MTEIYWFCSNCRSGGKEPENRRAIKKQAKAHGKKRGHRTNLVINGLIERVTAYRPKE